MSDAKKRERGREEGGRHFLPGTVWQVCTSPSFLPTKEFERVGKGGQRGIHPTEDRAGGKRRLRDKYTGFSFALKRKIKIKKLLYPSPVD